jgi:predicted peroxiredoxin/TusA-related sulfurtransferase
MKRRTLLTLFVIFILMTNQMNGQEILDFSGKTISGFIIVKLSEKLDVLQINESVKIKTENYKAIQQDLYSWSRMSGNKIVLIDNNQQNLTFEVTKLVDKINKGKSFSIIVSDKGLEELLSPLGFSVGAAMSGYQVNIYFQGPAVKVLEKGFKEKLKGFNSIFSGFARSGLVKIGHSPAQNKLRILEKYGAKFYVCQPSMEHFNLKEKDIAFSNIVICEYFTFLEVLEKSDIKFFLQ